MALGCKALYLSLFGEKKKKGGAGEHFYLAFGIPCLMDTQVLPRMTNTDLSRELEEKPEGQTQEERTVFTDW